MQRRHHRQGQQFAEQADNHEGERGPCGKPDHRADHGEQGHLREIDRKNVAAGGAERLERGDDVAAAVDMALDRVGDADPADQERREADQREELGEALDGALELRRGVGTRADLPTGLGKRLSRFVDQRGGRPVVGCVVRQLHAIDPAHQAAGLQQLRGAQACLADQEARSEADAAGELVRLGLDQRADLKHGAADADAVADLEIEPRQQRRIHDGPEGAVAFGQCVGDRHVRCECQPAQHRIGAIHRLEFDQGAAAVVGTSRHAAQRRRDRQRCRANGERQPPRAWPRAGSAKTPRRRPAACAPPVSCCRRGSPRRSRRRRSPSRRAQCRPRKRKSPAIRRAIRAMRNAPQAISDAGWSPIGRRCS